MAFHQITRSQMGIVRSWTARAGDAAGDSELQDTSEIPGLSLEKVTPDWQCPVCGQKPGIDSVFIESADVTALKCGACAMPAGFSLQKFVNVTVQ